MTKVIKTMLNITSTISYSLVFKTVGLLSSIYQLIRQATGLKRNIKEQIEEKRLKMLHNGVKLKELGHVNEFDRYDTYLQVATGTLAILNAYSIAVGEQTPLTNIVSCGLIVKSATDLAYQAYEQVCPNQTRTKALSR